MSKFTIESGDAVTTAANIVTGSRTELSNLFLQQLAVVIFAIRQHFKSQGEMLGEMDTNDGVRAALPEPHQLEATTQESFVCPTVLLSDGSVQSYLNGMKALLQETVGVVKSVVAYELHLRSLRQDLQKKVTSSQFLLLCADISRAHAEHGVAGPGEGSAGASDG